MKFWAAAKHGQLESYGKLGLTPHGRKADRDRQSPGGSRFAAARAAVAFFKLVKLFILAKKVKATDGIEKVKGIQRSYLLEAVATIGDECAGIDNLAKWKEYIII